jgi:hypothetical protein
MYLADESRKSWEVCEPAQSDDTALLRLCETKIDGSMHVVRLHDFDSGKKVREKELPALSSSIKSGDYPH